MKKLKEISSAKLSMQGHGELKFKSWIGLVASVDVLLLGSCSYSPAEQTPTSATNLVFDENLAQVLSVDTVQAQDIVSELTLNGRVTFNQEQVVPVYSLLGGVVTNVYVEVGDYVQKGTVLAEVRSSEVAEYEKQKLEAAQQVRIAHRNLDAARDMQSAGMTSGRDMLLAEQDVIAAEAELKRLEEISSLYHFKGQSSFEIKSPTSGFIAERAISRQMQLRPDQEEPLFIVSGLDDVWVIADVYESDISKVREGSLVEIGRAHV